MHVRRRIVTLAVTCIAVLALSTSGQAITNGQPDGDDHPYVGLLVTIDLDANLASVCSGSLIAADVLLTAGHCTDGAELALVWFDEVWPVLDDPAELANPDAVGVPHTHPDFCLACGAGLPGFAFRDVGVVEIVLAPGGVPAEHADLPAAGDVDDLANRTPIDVVGYGVTFQARIPGSELPQPPPFFRWDGFGTRLFAPTELVSGKFKHGAEFMKVAQNPGGGSGGTCFGDSGGPNLLGGTDTVLAVNSFGANPNCSGVGYAARVDVPDVLSWIDGFLP